MTRRTTGWMTIGLLLAATGARAATLYSVSPVDDKLTVIDPATAATVSSVTITLNGGQVGKSTALANHPQTGQLWAATRVTACPGRSVWAKDCGDLTADGQAVCDTAFENLSDRAVACHWNGSACVRCSTGSTDPSCPDACFTTPTCPASPARTLTTAPINGCGALSGDQTACEAAFTAESACGSRTCWYDGGTCKTCTVQDETDGKCTSGCGPAVSASSVQLVTLDPATGVATSHGELGDRFAALAFTCDGTLYGVTGDGACGDKDTLYRIDTTDASRTKLVTLGNANDGEVLAFNPLDGKLYYASGDNDDPGLSYLAIDPVTLVSTPLTFDTLLDDEEVQAIAWSEADQAFLWKQYHGAGPLFRTSPDGQTVVKLGDTDHQLHGLAFAEPVAACIACGDGLRAVTEACDDGNTTDRDCCAANCTVEDAGYPGAACELGNLLAPTLCDGGVEAKTAKQVAKRGGIVRKLVGKAEAAAGDAKKQAKRLKAARRQLVALQKAVKKRTAKLGETCAADVQGVLTRLVGIVDGI